MDQFQRSLAVIIGIQDYSNHIPPLQTPIRDATRLAQVLADEHGYETLVLTEQVTLARLRTLLESELPNRLDKNDRLLVYFAGHGVALTDENGPAGYLIPQDANAAEPAGFLPMAEVQQALENLPCRHVLIILDCCFAGAFR